MNANSVSLLERLKRARPGATEWRRLQKIYLSLVRCSWSARGAAELGLSEGPVMQAKFHALKLLREGAGELAD